METRTFKIENLAVKTSDLQIGNWVMIKGDKEPLKVISIQYDAVYVAKPIYNCIDVGVRVKPEDIEPIPVTIDIIEKNGWKLLLKVDDIKKYWNGIRDIVSDGVGITIKHNWEEFEIVVWLGGDAIVKIFRKYVHQLQNILNLVGFEKEIKL